jgi:hypothetical protein
LEDKRLNTRSTFILLVVLGIILPFAVQSFVQSFAYFPWMLMSPPTAIWDIAVILLVVAFIYYVIKYIKVDRRFIAVPIILLIVSTGVILSSVLLSRTVFSSTGTRPLLYPEHLSGGFVVTESDTGIHSPILEVVVNLDRHGEYNTDFVIQFVLLNYTLEQLEEVSNISSLVYDEQCVGYYWFTVEPPTLDFPLENIPCTYAWVLWIQADSIPEVWTIDVTLTLMFSIL